MKIKVFSLNSRHTQLRANYIQMLRLLQVFLQPDSHGFSMPRHKKFLSHANPFKEGNKTERSENKRKQGL